MEIRAHAPTLKSLYKENDYPSEQIIKNENALLGFTREFNSRTGGAFMPRAIAAELERVRKDKKYSGGLPKLGRGYKGPKFL
jgi:hypothetical protein